MIAIVSKIAVIFIIGAVGFIANKIGVLPKEANDYMIPLLMKIATPCLVIHAITTTELTPELATTSVVVLIGTIIYFAAGLVIARFIVRLAKLPKKDEGVYISLINMVNSGFMGLPVTSLIFGDHILYLMALCNVILTIWMYSICIFQMHIGANDGKSFKFSELKKSLKPMANVCTISCIAALIVLFAGIPVPNIADQVFEYIGDMCAPLSMLVVGVQLGESDLAHLIFRKDLWICTISNLLILPALATAVVYFMPIGPDAKLAIAFASAFPSAVAVVAVAAMEEKNMTLASEGVAMATAFSALSLPLAAFVMSGLFGF